MPSTASKPISNSQQNRRHRKDRRSGQEQREEIRFEPNIPNRRAIINRRRSDKDYWEAASHED